jgi:hypothetical protein
MLFAALIGSLTMGASFVGIAMASQLVAPRVVARFDSGAIAETGATWLSSLDDATAASADPIPVNEVLPPSVPLFLDIPAINVHSSLQVLGLDEVGAIETPTGARYDEAGWYRHSPTPGSIGPAIILGHVDSAANGPSVFFSLGDLARGDLISVTRTDGSEARFMVDAVRQFAKDGFPTDLVYGDLDHAALRLITCGGVFDDGSGHYEANTVVFASLENREY